MLEVNRDSHGSEFRPKSSAVGSYARAQPSGFGSLSERRLVESTRVAEQCAQIETIRSQLDPVDRFRAVEVTLGLLCIRVPVSDRSIDRTETRAFDDTFQRNRNNYGGNYSKRPISSVTQSVVDVIFFIRQTCFELISK